METVIYNKKEWQIVGRRSKTCSVGTISVVDLKRRGERKSVDIRLLPNIASTGLVATNEPPSEGNPATSR